MLDAAPYRAELDIGVPTSDYPESALGQHPTNEREMMAPRIDPAGARRASRRCAALWLCRGRPAQTMCPCRSHRSNSPPCRCGPADPGGYEGPDNGETSRRLHPPQLIDLEFYSNFQGQYLGTETMLSPSRAPGRSAPWKFACPSCACSPRLIQICTNCVVVVKHLKGTEDFTCPIPWDSWIFKLPFIKRQALRDALTVKGIKIEASRSAHYLILTPRQYRADLNEFALWNSPRA
jgi:hypothetical protein